MVGNYETRVSTEGCENNMTEEQYNFKQKIKKPMLLFKIFLKKFLKSSAFLK